ncbi:MAG: SH3 domain-containing protein, partial [Anaerolineales bacterium]
VTAYALSIRPDPSTTYAALGYLRYGDEVEVWEESGQGKWARIDPDESRWVSTGYLKVGD